MARFMHDEDRKVSIRVATYRPASDFTAGWNLGNWRGVEHAVVIGCADARERERERERVHDLQTAGETLRIVSPPPSIQFGGACYYFSACYSADYSRNRCEY